MPRTKSGVTVSSSPDEERKPSAAATASLTSSNATKITVLQSQQSEVSGSSSNSRRQRAETNATTTTTASDEVTSSHHRQRRQQQTQKLQISDRRLVKLARLAAASIDWERLQYSSVAWTRKKRTTIVGGGEFNITTHQEGAVHHIMASGSIACSVQEIKHVLWTTTNERYTAAMAELHGPSFMSGTALYRIKSSQSSGSASAAASASSDQSLSSHAERSSGFDVSVKTATFAKAHVFGRNEQWCYLDFFQPLRTALDHAKFTLTMHSLRPEDVLPGGNRLNPPEPTKNQLQETTAGYSVWADPRGSFVWLSFYARYLDTDTGEAKDAQTKQRKKLEASKSTTKARLMKMAKATCSLPLIVQRRRLGAQVFANPKAFAAPPPKNRHCKCCTVALTLLVPKKRCHLCSYRVCTKCTIKQQIERSQSNSTQVVSVCTTCMRRVNAADYDELPSGTASPACIKANSEEHQSSGKSASKTLVDFLRNSFEKTDDAARKQALMQVARSLLESQEDVEASSSSSQKNRSLPRHHSSVDSKDSKRSDEDFYMNALESKLRVKEYALEECQVAHPETRAYPIEYREADPVDGVTEYPIPSDEQQRVDFVGTQRLSDFLNSPELEIICVIASQEMQCAAGLVTVIAQDKIHIVASNDLGYQNLVVPREESICSHMVMSDKPLLLPHPAADIRFNKMPPVASNGVRFYCGFPLLAPDKTVFGSVCCVDSKSHEVTQAQYSVMMKLATTATRVMELHGANANAQTVP